MAIFPTPLTSEDITTVIRLHAAYRDYVKNEDSIINYRTTWLITLQSVLFGIYGFTLQKRADVLTILMTSTTLGPNREAREAAVAKMMLDPHSYLGSSISLLNYIIASTPMIGIFLCVIFIISLYAAYAACSKVRRCAAAHIEVFTALSLPGITGGGAFGIPTVGSMASFFVPLAMVIFWFSAKFIIASR